jgi:hypothetical protein
LALLLSVKAARIDNVVYGVAYFIFLLSNFKSLVCDARDVLEIHNAKLDHAVAVLNSLERRTNFKPAFTFPEDLVYVLAYSVERVHDLIGDARVGKLDALGVFPFSIKHVLGGLLLDLEHQEVLSVKLYALLGDQKNPFCVVLELNYKLLTRY